MPLKVNTIAYKIKLHLRKLGERLKFRRYDDPTTEQRASTYGYNRYKDALLRWSKDVLTRY